MRSFNIDVIITKLIIYFPISILAAISWVWDKVLSFFAWCGQYSHLCNNTHADFNRGRADDPQGRVTWCKPLRLGVRITPRSFRPPCAAAMFLPHTEQSPPPLLGCGLSPHLLLRRESSEVVYQLSVPCVTLPNQHPTPAAWGGASLICLLVSGQQCVGLSGLSPPHPGWLWGAQLAIG